MSKHVVFVFLPDTVPIALLAECNYTCDFNIYYVFNIASITKGVHPVSLD